MQNVTAPRHAGQRGPRRDAASAADDLGRWGTQFLSVLDRLTAGDPCRAVYDHVVGDHVGLDPDESARLGHALALEGLVTYPEGDARVSIAPVSRPTVA